MKHLDVLCFYHEYNDIQKRKLQNVFTEGFLSEKFSSITVKKIIDNIYHKALGSNTANLLNITVSEGSFRKWTKAQQINDTMEIFAKVNNKEIKDIFNKCNTIIKFLINNEKMFIESFKCEMNFNINVYMTLCETLFYYNIKMISMVDIETIMNASNNMMTVELKPSSDNLITQNVVVEKSMEQLIEQINNSKLIATLSQNLKEVKSGKAINESAILTGIGITLAASAALFFFIIIMRTIVYFFFNLRSDISKWSDLQIEFLEAAKTKVVDKTSPKFTKMQSMIDRIKKIKEFVSDSTDYNGKVTGNEISKEDNAIKHDVGFSQATSDIL